MLPLPPSIRAPASAICGRARHRQAVRRKQQPQTSRLDIELCAREGGCGQTSMPAGFASPFPNFFLMSAVPRVLPEALSVTVYLHSERSVKGR